MKKKYSAIDVFCGIGGLSYGLKEAGIPVLAGIDLDNSCRYAFEENIKADFITKDISELRGSDILDKYWSNKNNIKILVGCAPCQPFSSHSNKNKNKERSKKWHLLNEFKRLVEETNPEIISMENVPNLSNQQIFIDFVSYLEELNYNVSSSNIYCPDYGIPQKRRRLVLLASRLAPIEILPKTHEQQSYISTQQVIGNLPRVASGEICKSDPLHRTTKLTEINLQRIKASKPNGTWLDWKKELRLKCHKKLSGDTYRSVYGRMSWDEPSPTITTQFYNYGTGRFGHPKQNRALTIREAALLQSFPLNYKFYDKEENIFLTKLGTHIGNAVPPRLGYIIGKTIIKHIEENYG
ncbi:MAG: DNA (cytosine-5-)-methyltransferase [Ignavibacteria bacterium GWB2_35_12]|nr:MAG: DNA (cytosine-5-)-methyltransferase [Ignavibacteria bacterium GWA2_35_8]OGU40235.1 MAG: DNA (cytosine-5-)-methyltransferase [Ignavibacteria bacterium GWB2_35_12]OGU92551.1 MAG: DNA (cytosine-5-)-methyltransferase [Ignavibacteria bacterium RIFOXYA2_FULL_35_10]OGV23053.1 MAG: DNA (cytosine-5-)-methyltransferase [Ignavibacteria bacterium RIFOXYC2_FULL_35_21]